MWVKTWGLFDNGRRWKICADDENCSAIQARWPALAAAHDIAPGHDDAAVRRARHEARRGRVRATEAVAIHQREKHA